MNYRQFEEVRSTGIKESTPGESATDLEQQQQQERRQRVHVAPVGKDIIKSVIAGLPRIYNRIYTDKIETRHRIVYIAIFFTPFYSAFKLYNSALFLSLLLPFSLEEKTMSYLFKMHLKSTFCLY